MKALHTLILLLIAGFAGAQIVYPPTGNVNGVNRYKGVLIVDSGIVIPMRDTVGFFGNKPTITIRPQDSTLYFFNGSSYEKIETDLTKFVKYSDSTVKFVTPAQLRDSIVANSIDTTSLSNRINTKLSATDTAYLSNRINLKLNAVDTMWLSNRIEQRMRYIDTIWLSNRIDERVKYVDSNIKYVTPSGLSSAIAANAIDTTSLSNRIEQRVKYTDTMSFHNQIQARVKYSDTMSFHNQIMARMRYSDTVSLSNRIDDKLNKADTLSLSNRINAKLNSVDTASLSNRINQKFNTADTIILSNRINQRMRYVDTVSMSNRIDARQKYSDTTSFDATRHWVSTRGYLTSEIDGSITNELQTLSRSGSTISLSNGGGGFHDSFARYTANAPLVMTGSYPSYSINWAGTTSNVSEGSNLYFTNTRARSAISAGGDLSYNSSTGLMSYTMPIATTSSAGAVSIGSGLTVNAAGRVSTAGFVLLDIIRNSGGAIFLMHTGSAIPIDTTKVDVSTAGLMSQSDKIKLYSSGTGSVTSVGITGSGALSFGGSPITTSGTFTTSWTGTTGQYIRGDGSLATFPTIPTVNNGTLTLATSGIATGSASFTANQSGSSTFTVNVPNTLSSYTNDAGFINSMPTLQQVTTAGNTTNRSIVFNGNYSLPIISATHTGSGSYGGDIIKFDRGNLANYYGLRNTAGSWAIPEYYSYNTAANVPKMIFTAAGNDNWAANPGVIIRAQNATATSEVTNAIILSVRNHTTQLLNVRHDGLITMSNLAGTGNRIVTADASGNLSASIAAPLSGAVTTVLTSTIAGGSQGILTTATVTGAVVGDVVALSQPTSTLIFKGVVTAANTVTIYALNPTAINDTVPSGTTINIRIIK